MKVLQGIAARVNRASLRERALLFGAAVGLLALGWNVALMTPLAQRRAALAHKLEEIRLRAAVTGVGEDHDSPTDRYAAVKSKEAALTGAVAAADAQLLAAEAGMIAPQEMVTVLTEVLGHQQGLTLVLLRNLPVEPLLPPLPVSESAGASAAPPGAALSVTLSAGTAPPADVGPYLHPVELVVRGDYLHVLAYLQELESRPWGFAWRHFEYTMTPDGPQFRIEFSTLSMQPNWLGV